MGREIDAYLLADGGATVKEPGPGVAEPPCGMAWQEGLGMAPKVRRRRRRRAALQQGRRATRGLLARAPVATAGGAGPPAGAAPAGRRRARRGGDGEGEPG